MSNNVQIKKVQDNFHPKKTCVRSNFHNFKNKFLNSYAFIAILMVIFQMLAVWETIVSQMENMFG